MSAYTETIRLNQSTAMPAVGYGTYLIDDATAPTAVAEAICAGYRHIDTASGYQNEAGVGAGVAAGGVPRAEVFVTTKLWPGNPAWGDAPKTYEQTLADCQTSLDLMGMDYADLYLIHAPYGGAERIGEWRALLDLQQAGKARSVGVSNFNMAHLEEIRAAGLPMPEVNQIELHPWSQKPDLLDYMKDHDIAAIAYSSLVPLSTWRSEPGQESAKTDQMRADGIVFTHMAAKYGVTEAQLLLRWGVQNGFAVLPKSLNPARMRQNIELGGFSIETSDMERMARMDRGAGVAWASGDPSQTE